MSRRTYDHIAGCLLGGAVGDALGAPVEFMSIRDIRAEFGPQGVTEFAEAFGRLGAITDDTQMTLFTAEGVLLACEESPRESPPGYIAYIYRAYLRWLGTQGIEVEGASNDEEEEWLCRAKELHARRAPGNTCISALASGRMGTMDAPLNDSKGCGGVMRVAPVALLFDDPEQTFQFGCESAAITHGHPSGYLPAGALALMLWHVFKGESLENAVSLALAMLETQPQSGETVDALRAGMALAERGEPTPEALETLGGGWVGEEALAISVCCALCAEDDFARGVRLAVNHSGDSDSTGAITGNILGALLGREAIPNRWLDRLELRSTIGEMAGDLARMWAPTGRPDWGDDIWRKYPPQLMKFRIDSHGARD